MPEEDAVAVGSEEVQVKVKQVAARRGVLAAALATATSLIAGLLIIVASSEGDHVAALELGNGQAWFVSRTSGTAALIDGGTGTRVTRVSIGRPGDILDAVQSGSSLLAVDRSAGTVQRVDGTDWSAMVPKTIGSPNDNRLTVYANEKVSWVVSQAGSVLQELDPKRLATVAAPLTTPGRITGAALAASGALWLSTDRGELRSYKDGEQITAARLPQTASTALVMSGDFPVLVDTARRSATLIDPTTGKPKRSVCLDIPPDGEIALAPSSGRSPWVLATNSLSATLMVSRTDTGGCQPIVLGNSGNGARYGAPVEKDRLVYVPDFVAGTVLVVDPDTPATSKVTRRVNIGLPNRPVRLLTHNEHVWFDEERGDTAGVITDDLTAIAVSKSNDDTRGRAVPTDPQAGANSPGTTAEDKSPGASVPRTAQDRSNGTPQGSDGSSGQNATRSGESGANAATSGESGPGSVGATESQPGGISDTDGGTSDQSTTTVPDSGGPTTVPPPLPLHPEIGVSPSSTSVQREVTLTDTTAGEHTRIWRVPDATITSGTTTSAVLKVKWATKGTHTVTLTVTNSAGSVPTQKSVNVDPQPVVPKLTGLTEGEAIAALRGLPLKLNYGPNPVNSLLPAGRIAVTTPAEGQSVPEGTVIIAQPSTGRGRITTRVPGGSAALPGPRAMAADAQGNLYVVADNFTLIKKVDRNGTVTPFVDQSNFPPDSGCVNQCTNPVSFRSIAVGADGLVYAGDVANARVVAINPQTRVPTRIAGSGVDGSGGDGGPATSAQLFAPISLTFDVDGSLLIGTFSNPAVGGAVRRVDKTSRVITNFTPGLQLIFRPQFAANPSGFYAYTGSGNQVSRVRPSPSLFAGAGGAPYNGDEIPATTANVSGVSAMAFDSFGNLYIADAGSRIRMVDTSGIIHTVAGGATSGDRGDGGLATDAVIALAAGFTSMAIDPAGTLCFNQFTDGSIRCIT